jgi:stearoyl-CoA desaturase (delta-9 desaturase)
MGWMFNRSFADPNIYCRNLVKDPIVVFVSRTFIFWVFLSLVIPFAIGGWTGLLWGGLVRIFLTHHITWSVNSVCHTFGKREFETRDQSRNEWIVGLLGLGEGWHNNHHAFPRSAFHGLHWWQFDLSGYVIWTLERIGLVRDVYRVSPAMLERYAAKKMGVESEVITSIDVKMVPENTLV